MYPTPDMTKSMPQPSSTLAITLPKGPIEPETGTLIGDTQILEGPQPRMAGLGFPPPTIPSYPTPYPGYIPAGMPMPSYPMGYTGAFPPGSLSTLSGAHTPATYFASIPYTVYVAPGYSPHYADTSIHFPQASALGTEGPIISTAAAAEIIKEYRQRKLKLE